LNLYPNICQDAKDCARTMSHVIHVTSSQRPPWPWGASLPCGVCIGCLCWRVGVGGWNQLRASNGLRRFWDRTAIWYPMYGVFGFCGMSIRPLGGDGRFWSRVIATGSRSLSRPLAGLHKMWIVPVGQ
jgi:hypothetical protein